MCSILLYAIFPGIKGDRKVGQRGDRFKSRTFCAVERNYTLYSLTVFDSIIVLTSKMFYDENVRVYSDANINFWTRFFLLLFVCLFDFLNAQLILKNEHIK